MSQCLQLRREAIYHTYSTLVDKKFLFYFIDTKVQMHWEQIFLRISESLIVCHSNQIHVSSDLISYWGKVWRSLEWTWCPWNWMSSHCRQRSTHILKGYCLKITEMFCEEPKNGSSAALLRKRPFGNFSECNWPRNTNFIIDSLMLF